MELLFDISGLPLGGSKMQMRLFIFSLSRMFMQWPHAKESNLQLILADIFFDNILGLSYNPLGLDLEKYDEKCL